MVAVRMSRSPSRPAVVRVALIRAALPNSASMSAITQPIGPAQAATGASLCTRIVPFSL
jgi:hypothetical protein